MTSGRHIASFALLTLAAVTLPACGSKKSGGGKGGGSTPNADMSLEQSDSFSESLGLAGNDEIMALGRLDANRIAVCAKSGGGWNVDVEEGKIEEVPAFFKVDASASRVFTVSNDYVWVLFDAEGMVGRNKKAPDANRKFEISKVPLEGIVEDATELTPLAVSPDQLFAMAEDGLVVFTFTGDTIQLKKVPLPSGKLKPKEYVLGAGPIDEFDADLGYWMVSNQRLLFFKKGGWSEEPLTVKSDEESPSLISMMFVGKDAKLEGQAVGLFGANVLATFSKSGGKDAKKAADAKARKKK